MTKERCFYLLTEAIRTRFKNKYGKPLACRNCGKVLRKGDRVLTKISTNHGTRYYYCDPCRRLLGIWRPA